MLQLFNTDFVVHVRKSEIKRKRKGKADHNVDESGQTSVMKKFKADHNVDESGVGGEGPTVPSQPLDRVKHTCPVSAAVGVDRRSSEDPTGATGVLLCNGDYLKK